MNIGKVINIAKEKKYLILEITKLEELLVH